MPPPMPNPSKRMTANPAKPVKRYHPGKALAETESSDEDAEEDYEEELQQAQPQRRAQNTQPRPQKPRAAAQRDESEDEDEEGFVTEDEDEDGGVAVTQATSGVRNLPTTATNGSAVVEVEDDASEGDDSESEEESSEESSSEDEPQRKFQRPTFIKKSERNADFSKTAATNLEPA